MAIEGIGSITPLTRLMPSAGAGGAAPTGFAGVLNGMLAQNQQANGAADQAISELVTGQAQDLHTVSLAVAQADLSFRLILELRNRLTEATQEVLRMQV